MSLERYIVTDGIVIVQTPLGEVQVHVDHVGVRVYHTPSDQAREQGASSHITWTPLLPNQDTNNAVSS